MNVFLVEGGAVRGTKLGIFNSNSVQGLSRWQKSGENRIVYSVNKDIWYQLATGAYWIVINNGKPKVVAMAELIGAIPKFTLKEMQNEISSYSFFDKR